MQPASTRALLLVLVAGYVWPPAQAQQVTFDRIQHADKEPQNWLTYSGNNMGQRYSPLNQITPANVKNLELQWVWQARSLEKFETTAIVVDGIMYTIQAPNDVVALDAVTGRPFWTTPYTNAPEARPCCGRVNRGLAILGDTLFMGTLDAHLLALDAKTGKIVWNTKVAEAKDRYAFTHAPADRQGQGDPRHRGWRDVALHRGFIAALDAKTGKESWRFNTIPGPGEPRHETWAGDSWKTGGAAIWKRPARNAIRKTGTRSFWGIGNPAPYTRGCERLGDNLYSVCVVALDADTGKLGWRYQFTPMTCVRLMTRRKCRCSPISTGSASRARS